MSSRSVSSGYVVLAYSGKWVFRRFAFAKILHEVALSSSKAVREQKLAEQALPPLDSKRSIVKLILLAIVWMLVFWVSSLFLAGALAGFLNPKNAQEAGGKVGESLSGPFLLIALGLSIWLTVAGKLPGTKKIPVARAGHVAVGEQKSAEQALCPLDSKRSVVKLILLAIVWMLVFWVSALFLTGFLAGMFYPKDTEGVGGKLGESLSGPFLLIALGLSIWLTVAGKLPGTKKTPVARAGPVTDGSTVDLS